MLMTLLIVDMLALAGHDPCVAICVYDQSVDRVISTNARPTCRNLIETSELSAVTCLWSQGLVWEH